MRPADRWRSVTASTILSAISLVAWCGIMFGEDNSGEPEYVMLGEDLALQEMLVSAGPQWSATPGSADWPSTRNPLKDFDKGFKTAEKGFPKTTGTANWPSERNPLKDFDIGFKAKWKGYQGPENNVLAKMPANYPYLETVPAPDQSTEDYAKWANKGGEPENNVFNSPGYQFPDY